jgi:hypothetical protein
MGKGLRLDTTRNDIDNPLQDKYYNSEKENSLLISGIR